MLQEISPDLENFGHRVATDIHSMGKECELQPPRLEYFDAWGQRVDNIQTCQGWKQLHDVAAQEGLISIAFERKYAQWRYYPFFMFIHCMFLALPHTCKAKEVIFTTRDQILQPKFTRLSSKKLKGA